VKYLTQTSSSASVKIARLVASFFYVGFVPIIPGTFGSLAAFIPYFLVFWFAQWWIYVATIVFIIIFGIWAAGKAERDSQIVDPSFVVIDEVAGQLITLFLIPFSWLNLLGGFLLFRALDIVKPFPARQAEKLPGGWGIMTDDVLAGIYGNLILRFGLLLWEKLF
jgi:phosphatidylglycerophosphatase A